MFKKNGNEFQLSASTWINFTNIILKWRKYNYIQENFTLLKLKQVKYIVYRKIQKSKIDNISIILTPHLGCVEK